MNSTQYRQWLEKQRKELAHMYDADPLGEYSTYAAAVIAEEASKRASDHHLPELMRVWSEQAEVPDVDRYLVECLAAISEPKIGPTDSMSVKQVAERLKVSKETIYSLCADGTIPHTRVARRIIITPQQLAEYQRQAVR